MIKANEGTVAMNGQRKMIMVEMGCIMRSYLDHEDYSEKSKKELTDILAIATSECSKDEFCDKMMEYAKGDFKEIEDMLDDILDKLKAMRSDDEEDQ